MPRERLVDHAITERFQRLDAQVRGFSLDDDGDGALRLAFYPWWEHPKVVAAVAAGSTFRLTRPLDALRVEATLHARTLRKVSLEAAPEVTEWCLLEHHALLFSYEPTMTLVVQQRLDARELASLLDVVEEQSAGWHARFAFLRARTAEELTKQARDLPFELGALPRSVAEAVCAWLEDRRARFVAIPAALDRARPKLLMLDGEDHLIAERFELDLPELVHDDAWVDLRGG